MLIALIVGLAIAGCWGLADIQSSLVTISTTRSTIIAQGSGMVVLLLCGMLFGGTAFSLSIPSISIALIVLVGLGCVSALGYFSLYKAFQSALPVGLVSALVASNGAISTLLSWLVFHDANLTSVVLLLCGVVLVASKAASTSTGSMERHPARASQTRWAWLTLPFLSGVGWALVAALCLGGFNFGLGVVSSRTQAWYVLLLGGRAFSLVLLSLVLAGTKSRESVSSSSSWKSNLLLASGVGVAEMLGLLGLGFSMRAQGANLTIILAASSCFVLLPLGYSLFRGLRLHRLQQWGLGLILVGLLTLPSNGWPFGGPVATVLVLAALLVLWLLASALRENPVRPILRRTTHLLVAPHARGLRRAWISKVLYPALACLLGWFLLYRLGGMPPASWNEVSLAWPQMSHYLQQGQGTYVALLLVQAGGWLVAWVSVLLLGCLALSHLLRPLFWPAQARQANRSAAWQESGQSGQLAHTTQLLNDPITTPLVPRVNTTGLLPQMQKQSARTTVLLSGQSVPRARMTRRLHAEPGGYGQASRNAAPVPVSDPAMTVPSTAPLRHTPTQVTKSLANLYVEIRDA